MKNMFLPIYLVFLTVSGCKRPDPNAYRQDPIIIDYQSQLAATTSSLEALINQRNEILKELEDSLPQTGRATIHRKRMNEADARIRSLSQQVTYWKVRIESRAKEAQLEYLVSLKNNKPWPDQSTVDSYNAHKRLRLSKMAWDQKDRIEQVKKEAKEKTAKAPE